MYGWYERREGVFEVGVVPEDMAWEQRRDGGALFGCIEHQDEHTDVWAPDHVKEIGTHTHTPTQHNTHTHTHTHTHIHIHIHIHTAILLGSSVSIQLWLSQHG